MIQILKPETIENLVKSTKGNLMRKVTVIEQGTARINGRDFLRATLYKMMYTDKTEYRMNLEDFTTAKVARREYDGNGAEELARKEFDDLLNGDALPLDWDFQ